MKKTVLLALLLTLTLSADFLNSEKDAAKKHEAERARFCKIFTKKASDYAKNMRTDELAKITLKSYKKRADIYCAKEVIKKEKAPKVEKQQAIIKKNIYLEDARLCKIFTNKMEKYKKTMRDDELAYTTLESLKHRQYVFCSEENLTQKEKQVRAEDDRLCMLFTQGPKVCILFEKSINKDTNTTVAQTTFKSFKKQANIFCSDAELEEKDAKVHAEHLQLCQVYDKTLKQYRKSVKHDATYESHIKIYEKRFKYFCNSIKLDK